MRGGLVRLALALALWAGAATAVQPRLFLVLSAYGPEDAILAPVEHGVRAAISDRRDLALAVEHLDAGHPGHAGDTGATGLDLREANIRQKYAKADVAAVFALGEPAIDFARRARAEAFPDAPLVFGAAPSLTREAAEDIGGTGVVGALEIDRTLALIRDLHPDRDRLVVVGDATARGGLLRAAFDRALAAAGLDFAVDVVDGGDVDALRDALTGLSDRHAVFFLSAFDDFATVHGASLLDRLEQVVDVSQAPVYGAFDGMVGYGVVGGWQLDGRALGERLGRLALDLVDHPARDGTRIEVGAPHRYVFDYRQLARFGLTEFDLPTGSAVIEEPDTFYYRYRQYFWIAAALAAAAVALIVQLLFSLRQRERARSGLERLIAESARALPVDDPPAMAREVLRRLGVVAPFLRPLGAYRLTGDGLEPVTDATEAPPAPLVAEAVAEGRSRFAGRAAIVPFRRDGALSHIAHLRAARRLDVFDERLVDLFARTTSLEADRLRNARLSAGLEAARRIQLAMLPEDFSAPSRAFGLDIAATLEPATQVGGDFYDVFAVDGDRLCLVIGDVSDKGPPAALFMAITRTLIRSAVLGGAAPDAALAQVNDMLLRDNREAMFVTLFCALYGRDGRLDYANAGHNPPLLRRADGVAAPLPAMPNIALGAVPGMAYPLQGVTLGPGEAVLLYTDGVSEAIGPEGEFGVARLAAQVAAQADVPAGAVVSAIHAAVEAFAAGRDQYDDIALLYAARHPAPAAV